MLRFAGLDERDVRRVRLEERPLGAVDLDDWSGIVLGGGPFNVSDPPETEVGRRSTAWRPSCATSPSASSRRTSRSSAPATASARSAPSAAASSTGRTASRSAPSRIRLTDAGPRRPAARRRCRTTFDAFLGHKEAVSRLPDGAVLLASSAACPVQAFRLGRNVYATQFHPELDVEALLRADRGLPPPRLLRPRPSSRRCCSGPGPAWSPSRRGCSPGSSSSTPADPGFTGGVTRVASRGGIQQRRHGCSTTVTFLRRSPQTRLPLIGGLAAVMLAATACGGSSDAAAGSRTGDRDVPRRHPRRPASSRSPPRAPTGRSPSTRTAAATSPATTSRSPQAVADELGVEVKFEETQWDAIFAGLDAGRFDVIANQVSINPEREADYDFSKPYTVSPGVIVVNEDDDSISSFDDLEGKTTAQSLTSNWYELAEDSGANVEAVEGWAQAVDAAQAGPRRRHRQRRADLPRLREHRGRHRPGDRRRRPTTRPTTPSRSARAATRWSRPSTRRSRTLRADGTLAEISEKYFGEDVSR